ncbi:hypothetical protein M4R22_05740 [Acidovorax sp. GBBC 3334]|uniref:surface-adhesin E family protein n=1 Tax=Acidovorax sp. GBBC 3334 TaxID=2940496 RepID=UPI002304020A|nr:surface-adhesin E family protein [Acidovorax sp. GBBC 3334]MDA8454258.1 hypothetical protein [Acidovorax sp. GBBC 3334]
MSPLARAVLWSAAVLLASPAQPQPAAPASVAAPDGAAAAARPEEWLTIHGFPEVPDGDIVQINPTAQQWQNQITVDLRVSRSSLRTSYSKGLYRSYRGVALFDCAQRKGWYLSLQYFGEPLWQGPMTAQIDFKENEAPVTFAGIAGDPAGKLIRAACRKK